MQEDQIMRRSQWSLAAVVAMLMASGAAWAAPAAGTKSNPGWVEPYTLAAACGRPEPSARSSRGNPIPDPCAVYMSGVVDAVMQLNPSLLCPPNGSMSNPSNAQIMRRYLAAHPEARNAGGAALAALQAAYSCPH